MKGQWKTHYRPPTVHKSSDKHKLLRTDCLPKQPKSHPGQEWGSAPVTAHGGKEGEWVWLICFENVGMFTQNPCHNLVSSSSIHEAKDCLPVWNLRRVCHCWVDNWGLSPCCRNGSHHSWKYSCRCSNSRARLWTTGHYVVIHNQNTVSVFWDEDWSLPE